MSERGFFHNRMVDGIAAVSEATFPENDFGAPDWKSTQMVRRTIEYLDELPPAQRRLVALLFIAIELGAIFLVFGFRRFSRIAADRRTQVIRDWYHSRKKPLRILGEAIKATTTMIYMSHPSVLEHIGEYRACERTDDSYRIESRPGALAAMEPAE